MATLDKTTGVQAGGKVTLTVRVTGASGLTGYVAEALYDPNAVADPVGAGKLANALSMGVISEAFTTVTGFGRRSEVAGGILGGQPASGDFDLATFEFTTKSGFTSTSVGIRRLILVAGARADTVLASPSPLILTISASGSPGGGVAGDASGDGLVNAGDAILVLQHSVGLITLTPERKALADVNGDGLVNAGDAILVLQKSVGLIDKFPVQSAGKPVAANRNRGTVESEEGGISSALPPLSHSPSLPIGDGGGGLELGEVRVLGEGRLEVPLVLGSGVQGGDLRLAYDATANRVTQVKGPEGVLVVSNSAGLGEVLVSFARPDASEQVVLLIALDQGSGLPADGPVLRVTGRGFDLDGLPAGEVERVMDRPLTSSLRIYPNPFNPSTTIDYALEDAAEVRFGIYSVSGQLVRALVSERQAARRDSVVWDGRDDAGRPVASGIYVGRLDAGQFRRSEKMVLLK